MDAIVPLLFACPLEAGFWSQPPGLDHIRRLLRSVALLPGIRRVLVVTPEPGRWRHLESGAIAVRPPTVPLDMDGDLLANAPRLADLAAGGTWGDRGILCIDVRNPSLDGETVAKALAAFTAGKGPLLVATREITDHPCQCVRYSRVLDAGMVHLLDPEAWKSGRIRTRPFPGDADGEGGMTRLDVPGGPDRFPAPHPSRTPCGVFHASIVRPRAMSEENIPPAVTRDASGRAWLCFPHLAGMGMAHAAIQPFVTGGDAPPCSPRTLPIDLDDANGLSLDPDITTQDGFVYAVLQDIHTGAHDLVERIEPVETLWHYDASGACINACTGAPILGRQDFPALFEPDCSFLVASIAGMLEAETLFASGRAFGQCITSPLARIRTENDAKLVRARLRLVRN